MVGDIYPISYTELEEGQIILSGQLVSRQVYQVLWNWVEKHPSLLKQSKNGMNILIIRMDYVALISAMGQMILILDFQIILEYLLEPILI